jgi:L-lactate dehydrogenase complex protein LldF
MRLHGWLCRQPRLYRWAVSAGVFLLHRLGRRRGVLDRLPLAGGWLAARDLPTPAEQQSFLGAYRRRRRRSRRSGPA